MTRPQGLLSGIRIVEMDAIGPIPLAAMLLADFGAEVVRIVRPSDAGSGAWDDVGGAVLHRNRDYIHLNLKNSDDRERLLALIAHADALIEGFRPGVMERLGIGPEVCLASNPRLVFGRITGWGQHGPLSQRAGHDLNYLAITGALHAMGDGVGPPPVPLNLVGDYGGGAMFLVAGVLAAIFDAQRTGTGRVIDACITDGVAALMSLFLAWQSTGRWRDTPASNLLDGAAPYYRCYRCADGKHLAVGCLEPKFFAELVQGLGLQARGYVQDAREGWPAMAEDFRTVFATRTRDEWAVHFADTDACVTPVLSMSEAVAHPHNCARGTFIERGHLTEPAPAPRVLGASPLLREPQETTVSEIVVQWAGMNRNRRSSWD